MILQNNSNRFRISVYIEENVNYISVSYSRQNQDINTGTKYSISGSYEGQIIRIRTFNGNNRTTTYQETAVAGTIGNPLNNTYMMLGANPTGNKAEANQAFFDGEISSVRIYNRALSDEENAVNYLNDRERYNL